MHPSKDAHWNQHHLRQPPAPHCCRHPSRHQPPQARFEQGMPRTVATSSIHSQPRGDEAWPDYWEEQRQGRNNNQKLGGGRWRWWISGKRLRHTGQLAGDGGRGEGEHNRRSCRQAGGGPPREQRDGAATGSEPRRLTWISPRRIHLGGGEHCHARPPGRGRASPHEATASRMRSSHPHNT